MLIIILKLLLSLVNVFIKKAETKELFRHNIMEALDAYNASVLDSAGVRNEYTEIRKRYLESLKTKETTNNNP